MSTQQIGTVANTLESKPLAVNAPRLPRSRQAEFARHAVVHTVANLGALACSGALAFALPRFLTMDDYGYYRLFLLYGSFAGILHFGFLDGLLLRWAVRPMPRLRNEISSALLFLNLIQVAFLIPLIVVVGIFLPRAFLGLAITIAVYALLWNWNTLGLYALQALKLFTHVSFFTLLGPFLILVTAVALHLAHRLDLRSLILVCLVSNLVAAGGLWLFVRHRVPGNRRVRSNLWSTGLAHIGLGWSLVCANLLAMFALSLDRLVLSRGFPIRQFAIYSFAANTLGLTYNMILSVARVLFPYLSDGISVEARVRAYFVGERALLVIWTCGLATFFPMAWLINRWLPRYTESLPLIRVLLLATGFTASIHVLHSTYFRVVRKQSRLLVGAVAGLASAALFLAIGARTGQLSGFACAMVASALTWWLVNEFLLRDILNHDLRRILGTLTLTAVSATAFLFCTTLSSLAFGFGLYLAWVVILFASAGRPLLQHLPLPWLRLLFAGPAENVSVN
jgi:O-antigen/teichoic acid export membrane protein